MMLTPFEWSKRTAKANYSDLSTCGDCGATGQYGDFCGNCGKPMHSNDMSSGKYCTSCGHKLSNLSS